MNLPWNKKEDPIEKELTELAEAWAVEDLNSDRRQELIQRYQELKEMQLEEKKLEKQGSIDAKTLFNAGVTIGLALLTLNFEQMETLRSKVTPLWLHRER